MLFENICRNFSFFLGNMILYIIGNMILYIKRKKIGA